ncbi:SDR family oxidoreductase [Salinifilum aidingensis]
MTTPTGKHVVVVGATGNVGTSVLHALEADPDVAGITAIARRAPGEAAGFGSKTGFLAADVARADLGEHLRGADAVIQLAWIFQPTRDPATTWRNNVLGTLRVFDAVAEAGVPALIYASSVGAYSPGPKDRRVDESWPTHGWPGAAYSREKAYLERCLDAFERRHERTRVVRLRPGFAFQAGSAAQQRRLFAGPLLPGSLARPEALPVLPDLPGLRVQTVHSEDLAEAYRLAVHQQVGGAFNIAAEPVLDAAALAGTFGARTVPVPAEVARSALALAWSARLVPASPHLFDAVLRLPLMDITRAHEELGWSPRHTARDAVLAFLEGLRRGQGVPTPPLRPRVPGGRWGELCTGVGQRQ